jgi:hypothetical protein
MDAWTVKVFFADGAAPPPHDFVPIFHRWIQEHALSELLIDVADYSHVHQGPGVLLVCGDAQYSIDQDEGRPGLLYARKRGSAAESLEGRIRDALTKALTACRLLEQDPVLAGRVRFRPNQVLVGVLDRLSAPNTPATFDAIAPTLGRLVAAMWDDAGASLEPVRDPRAPFRVRAFTSSAPGLETMLRRLSA